MRFLRKFVAPAALALVTLVNLMAIGHAAYDFVFLNDGTDSWYWSATTGHQIQLDVVANSGQTVTGPFVVVDPTNGFGLGSAEIFTVSTLPTCNAAAKGSLAMVSDATTPTYAGTLTGSGAVVIPVFCDGSNWKSH